MWSRQSSQLLYNRTHLLVVVLLLNLNPSDSMTSSIGQINLDTKARVMEIGVQIIIKYLMGCRFFLMN